MYIKISACWSHFQCQLIDERYHQMQCALPQINTHFQLLSIALPAFISISIYHFLNRFEFICFLTKIYSPFCMCTLEVCVCVWFFFYSYRIKSCLLWLQLRSMDAIDQFTLNKKKDWQRTIAVCYTRESPRVQFYYCFVWVFLFPQLLQFRFGMVLSFFLGFFVVLSFFYLCVNVQKRSLFIENSSYTMMTSNVRPSHCVWVCVRSQMKTNVTVC